MRQAKLVGMPDTTTEHQDAADEQPAASSGPDPSAAHPARVYNYWLGGKDHYPADRRAGDAVKRHRPQVVAGARANRAFLGRAVRYLAAEAGIRQFLDIGTGLPAPGGVLVSRARAYTSTRGSLST